MYSVGSHGKDIIVKVFSNKPKQVGVVHHGDSFVKVEHIPSGIVVTKHGSGSQIKIRDKAFEELMMLVKLWEN